MFSSSICSADAVVNILPLSQPGHCVHPGEERGRVEEKRQRGKVVGDFFFFVLIFDLILARRRLRIETAIHIHEGVVRECVALPCKKKRENAAEGGREALFSTWESIFSHCAAPPGLSPLVQGKLNLAAPWQERDAKGPKIETHFWLAGRPDRSQGVWCWWRCCVMCVCVKDSRDGDVRGGLKMQLDQFGPNNVARNDSKDDEELELQVVHLFVCAVSSLEATIDSSLGLWDGGLLCFSRQRRDEHSLLGVSTSLYVEYQNK